MNVETDSAAEKISSQDQNRSEQPLETPKVFTENKALGMLGGAMSATNTCS